MWAATCRSSHAVQVVVAAAARRTVATAATASLKHNRPRCSSSSSSRCSSTRVGASQHSRWLASQASSESSQPFDHHNDDEPDTAEQHATTTATVTADESLEPPSFVVPKTRSHSQKTLDELPITFADVSRAEVAIRGGVVRTTCERSHFISELVGANVYFKNEFRQFTGSFKERGARNAILKLMRDKSSSLRGVIAASAGNHALALAYHGQQLGVPVTVVMPTVAPLAKVDKCRVRNRHFTIYIYACVCVCVSGVRGRNDWLTLSSQW
jgi:Pyridoxal-phosphate dependent enzyme